MTSRERVHRALRRESVDRVPIYMWYHPDTVHSLATQLDLPTHLVGDAMGDDIRQTWVNNNYAMEGIVHEHDGEGHIDYWGIRWVKEGAFNQVADFPVGRATADEVLRYEFPTDHVEDLLRLMEPVVADSADRFLGCDVSPCVFEMYWRLRGMERALIDMFEEPEMTRVMFGRCADFAVELSERACTQFPLDWLWTGDDVGSQVSTIMSRESFQHFIKPNLARIFAVGKAHGLWVAYHSCGAIRPLIEDLIEIGLDVLNPVQCNATGMEPLALKREYGRHIAFMGGVDTQEVIPFGSVEDVRRATANLLEGMTADGGGYILAASHAIPPETPNDNIFALYEEAGISRESIFDRAADLRAACR